MRASLLAAALLSAGCAPLTFSNEAAIDFERYPSVFVSVDSDESLGDTAYLVEQLRADSGFSFVTADPSIDVRLLLSVQVVVTTETETDADGDTSTTYLGRARYTATRPDLTLVDRGEVEDESPLPFDIYEDVLDEVALHYLRPFRL